MSSQSSKDPLPIIDITINDDDDGLFNAEQDEIMICQESSSRVETRKKTAIENISSIVEHEVITIDDENNVQLDKVERNVVDIVDAWDVEHEVMMVCEENSACNIKESAVKDILFEIENKVIMIQEETNTQLEEKDTKEISSKAEAEMVTAPKHVDTELDKAKENSVENISPDVKSDAVVTKESDVQLNEIEEVDAAIQDEVLLTEAASSVDAAIQDEVLLTEAAPSVDAAIQDEVLLTEAAPSVDAVIQDEVLLTEAAPSVDAAIQDEVLLTEAAPSVDEQYAAFAFKNIPFQVTGAWKEFEGTPGNYTRGCKWSPDGSCILSCSNDNVLRIFNCPSEFWNPVFDWENIEELSSVLRAAEGECVYDYSWYPQMSSYDSATCCFASSAKDSPVHLWDAFTGALRCSYRSYNHLDEIVTPHSLSFDADGQKLFCGFHKAIRIFDVSRPGRECEERKTYSKKVGQAGIVSCFAFSPWYRNMSVVGSFNKTIGIYSEPSGFLEFILSGHQGGITHMCFSPDGTKLFSGSRKDPEILCWDMRNLGSILFSLRRICSTNQRMYFDISKCGRYLVSGNHNGIVTVWDIASEPKHVPNCRNPVLKPLTFFKAHNDCVNGISLHPTVPLLVTSSGQRQFPEPVGSEEESDECFHFKSLEQEISLKLWWDSNTSEDMME